MVGATRLTALARSVESMICNGDLRGGASVRVLISLQGWATIAELQAGYLRLRR
ncbi:hypothetical protein SB659_10720 [Arthrobacter sp. SIMBA_036]|uniref:hypothetical protein n=1 Tax=Arthrobacter sp. SIMBA_036 TaxID=3085778 RepID=UPI00397E2837